MGTIRTVGQTQGPAVLVDGQLLRRERPPGFDRQGQTGLEDEPAAALAAVGHVRILVHRVAEAVPAEVEVDGDAMGIGDVADGLRDIAEAVAGLGRIDSGFEAGPGGVDEALIVFAAVADDGGAGGVGDPAVDGYGEVEGEEVAVLHHVIVRFAVEDAVVDGQADDVPERAGAEGRGVVPVAGLRTGVVDELPSGLLQVHDVHARFCDRGQLGQGLRDETAGHRHLVDLGGRLQLNHRGLLQ